MLILMAAVSATALRLIWPSGKLHEGVRVTMRLREVSRVRLLSDAYSLYVRQRRQGSAQVFSLDYADKLKVYDPSGSLKSSTNWSSQVRCIAVGDVEGEGEDALIGGIGNRLVVVDRAGKQMWKVELESKVVGCDARDVDGDDAAEIVVALENRRVILWNDDKTALFSRIMDNPIADIWLEEMTGGSELEVVVADRQGNLIIMTAAGYELKRMKLGNDLSVFAVLSFGSRKLFVTGEYSNVLRVWDIDGYEIGSIELTGKPRALATGSPGDVSDTAYLVVSTDDKKLSFWQIQDTDKPTREERVTLQQLESTRTTLYKRAIKCGNCGAPALPESKKCESCGAVLEILADYKIEEFVKESIDSVTSKHERIKLRDLDRILRRTLPKPVPYNLRKSLQTMIETGDIDGYIEGNTFVRIKKIAFSKEDLPTTEAIDNIPDVLTSLLKGEQRFEIDVLESSTGVPRRILRQTLMILLGEGLVEGYFSGDEFVVSRKQNTDEFIRRLQSELMELNH